MYVGVGSEVKKGDPLMLVTAMKMAVQVVAPHNGKVVEIPVKVYLLLFLPSFLMMKFLIYDQNLKRSKNELMSDLFLL
jgi:hypothetical protein